MANAISMPTPDCHLTFSDGNGEVGYLFTEDGQLRFEGKTDEAARIFFDYLTKLWTKP